jgi:hypothetical protein
VRVPDFGGNENGSKRYPEFVPSCRAPLHWWAEPIARHVEIEALLVSTGCNCVRGRTRRQGVQMSSIPRLSQYCWIPAVAVVAGILLWWTALRAGRAEYVTALPGWYADPALPDPNYSTGISGDRRRLIIPEHNNDSFRWLDETEVVLRTGDWRVRRVEMDNAPYGRETQASPVYRTYLAALGTIVQAVTSWPLGETLEAVARWADPLLQMMLLAGSATFIARRVSGPAALVAAIGIGLSFPLAGEFVPYAPKHYAMAMLLAAGTLLPILTRRMGGSRSRGGARQLSTLCSGVCAGLGLLNSASAHGLLLGGVLVGALFQRLSERKLPASSTTSSTSGFDGRLWSAAAVCVLIAGFVAQNGLEAILTLRMERAHPVYAVWLLAIGLILHVPNVGSTSFLVRTGPWLAAVAIAVAVPIVGWVRSTGTFWDSDLNANRLTYLPGYGGLAGNSLSALGQLTGGKGAVLATLAPLLWLAAGVWAFFHNRRLLQSNANLAMGFGIVAAALLAACMQPRWAALFQFAIVAWVCTTILPTLQSRSVTAIVTAGLATLILTLPGVVLQWPQSAHRAGGTLSDVDVESLIARDVAHWLKQSIPADATVLAPPDLTTSMAYHARIRGLGTLYPENHDGMAAAVAIGKAAAGEEALLLLRQRKVAAIVLPSWDHLLDELVASSAGQRASTFLSSLRRLQLPNWIRPVPYLLPTPDGGSAKHVAVFRVAPEEEELPSDAVALARLCDYLLEMERIEAASRLLPRLGEFPADFAAAIGIARIHASRGDAPAFDTAMQRLTLFLEAGQSEELPWDQRVSLAVVLAHGRKRELAKREVESLWSTASSSEIKALPSGALYRLLLMTKGYGIQPADAELRNLALGVLPPALRQRI